MSLIDNDRLTIDLDEIDFGGYLLGFKKSFFTPPDPNIYPGQLLILAETTLSREFYTGRMLTAKITFVDKSYRLVGDQEQWLINIEVLSQ